MGRPLPIPSVNTFLRLPTRPTAPASATGAGEAGAGGAAAVGEGWSALAGALPSLTDSTWPVVFCSWAGALHLLQKPDLAGPRAERVDKRLKKPLDLQASGRTKGKKKKKVNWHMLDGTGREGIEHTSRSTRSGSGARGTGKSCRCAGGRGWGCG